MNQERIGKLISKIRKEKGLTQKELAEKLKISEKTISKWECGNSIPDISIVNELSTILEIDVRDLLNGKMQDKSYIRKTAIRSRIRKVAEIIFLILCSIITSYITKNYIEKKYDEVNITANDKDFSATAKIFINPKGKTLVLNNILYQGESAGTSKEPLVKNLSIFIISGEETLFTHNIKKDKPEENNKLERITLVLSNIPTMVTQINKDIKIDKDKTRLKIEYINEREEKETISINLKVF